jgi:hypothetical protein
MSLKYLQILVKYSDLESCSVKTPTTEAEPADCHLDTKDKSKGHSIFTLSDEINKTVPQSKYNPKP